MLVFQWTFSAVIKWTMFIKLTKEGNKKNGDFNSMFIQFNKFLKILDEEFKIH